MSEQGEVAAEGVHDGQAWRVRRIVDQDPGNPRDYDQAWLLVMSHRRRTLGDLQMDPEQFAAHKRKHADEFKDCIEIPVFAYEHGDIAFSTSRTGQFADQWDSGVAGVACMTRDSLLRNFNEDTPATRAAARELLQSELQEYQQYVNGEVFGFVYETRPQGSEGEWKEEDSCWGFYGSDIKVNGMLGHMPPHVAATVNPQPKPRTMRPH